jgi:hypothetical protein
LSSSSKYQAEKYTWKPFDEQGRRTVATLQDFGVRGFADYQHRYYKDYHSLDANHQVEWATIYDGPEKYVLINEPRESGKSITWSTETPVYEFLKDYNSAGLLVTASDALSKTYTRAIVDTMMMNKQLVEDFNTNWWLDMKKGREGFSAHEIFLKRTLVRREPSFMTAGVGKAIIGFHPDYGILDDIRQSEESRSGLSEDKMRDWVRRVLLPMQMKRLYVIGTRKGPHDIYQFFREMGIFKISSRRALSRIPKYEAQFDKETGKKFIILKEDLTPVQQAELVYWPQKYTLADLLMIREMIGAEAFSGEFQNDPIPATGQTFLKEWLEYYNYNQLIDSDLFREANLYTCFDPGGASEAADYNAIVTIALIRGRIYIIDVKYGHWRPKEAIKNIALTYSQWAKPFGKYPLVVGVEAEFLQGVFIDLGRALGFEYLPWRPLYPGRTTGDKAFRINSLNTYFSTHQVYVSEYAAGIEELKKEYLLYDPEKLTKRSRDKDRPRWDVLDAFQQCIQVGVAGQPALLGVKYGR